jgi:hypothetical protein
VDKNCLNYITKARISYNINYDGITATVFLIGRETAKNIDCSPAAYQIFITRNPRSFDPDHFI